MTRSAAPITIRLPGDENLLPLVRRGHRRYLIEIDGTVGTAAEWAEASDIPLSTLYDRLARGDRGRDLIRPSGGPGRRPRMLTVDGMTKSLDEWAKETGLPKSTISSRLHSGWPPELAVSKRLELSGKRLSKPLLLLTASGNRRPPMPRVGPESSHSGFRLRRIAFELEKRSTSE